MTPQHKLSWRFVILTFKTDRHPARTTQFECPCIFKPFLGNRDMGILLKSPGFTWAHSHVALFLSWSPSLSFFFNLFLNSMSSYLCNSAWGGSISLPKESRWGGKTVIFMEMAGFLKCSSLSLYILFDYSLLNKLWPLKVISCLLTATSFKEL